MMIARWHIDARFGHKPELFESMRGWGREIAPQIGRSADNVRIATGSIGAHESTVEDRTRCGRVAATAEPFCVHRSLGCAPLAGETE